MQSPKTSAMAQRHAPSSRSGCLCKTPRSTVSSSQFSTSRCRSPRRPQFRLATHCRNRTCTVNEDSLATCLITFQNAGGMKSAFIFSRIGVAGPEIRPNAHTSSERITDQNTFTLASASRSIHRSAVCDAARKRNDCQQVVSGSPRLHVRLHVCTWGSLDSSASSPDTHRHPALIRQIPVPLQCE